MNTAPDEEIEIPIGIALNEQLESIPDLGSDVEDGGFFARAGSRPIGRSVRCILRDLKMPEPADSGLYKRFELWCVPHRVAVIRRSGLAEPISVGIEIEYQNDSQTCSIVSLFPSFEYVEHGRLAGTVSFRGEMSPTGEISPASTNPDQSTPALLNLGGLKATASTRGEVSLHLESTVSTPSISAVGVGSSACEWRFDKKREPLFGRDIETWSIVVLPKRQRELRYRMRFYFTSRTVFFQTRRQSDWISVVCLLQD